MNLFYLQMDWSKDWKSWRKQQSSTKVKIRPPVNLSVVVQFANSESTSSCVLCSCNPMFESDLLCVVAVHSIQGFIIPLSPCRADGAHKEAAPSFL